MKPKDLEKLKTQIKDKRDGGKTLMAISHCIPSLIAYCEKLEAVVDASREYFTLEELKGLEFSPFFKCYNRAKDALKALDGYNNKGETP